MKSVMTALPARALALAGTIRRARWLDGCLYALGRLLETLSWGTVALRKYYFVAQPVATKPMLSPRRGVDLEIREMHSSDPLLRDFPRPHALILERFERGATCLAALKGAEWAGFIWFTLRPYQEDEVRCRYVPQPEGRASWDFDVFVRPEHRAGVAFLKLWDAANAFLAARGVRCSFSRISASNTGSLAAHRRMGARPVGSAIFLTLGSWQASVATVRPHFHFSARPGSFPVYTLPPSDETD